MASVRALQEVVAAWYDIDGRLQNAQNIAQSKGHVRIAQSHADLRKANDRAYFLLIFAHFEAVLTRRASTLIIRRQAAASWTGRRGWDVLNANADKIPFRNRLSYCLDRSSADWTKVSNYYTVRNDLAHEGSTNSPFVIPIVATDLRQIASRLKA
jgi:hypothetical protein